MTETAVLNQTGQQTKKTPFVVNLPENVLANEIVNLIQGEPTLVTAIMDANGMVYPDSELQKKGCVIATIDVARRFNDSNMVKKHRQTKEANPYLVSQTATEKYTVQVLLNCIWENVVHNRQKKHDGQDTGWQAQEKRSNGIENYRDSRVVCFREKNGKTTYYVNYIVLRYLSERVIVDEHGQEIDADYFDGFLKSPKAQKEKNRQREADKHGLEKKFDPQIRQMKMVNIDILKVLGKEYSVVDE